MDDPQRYERWYDTGFGRRADRIEKRILADLLAEFAGPGPLLDVGCGTGHFANRWASLGMRAAGVDSSPARLRFARERRPGFPVVLGDATALPFRSASFDVVALVTVLEFLTSPEEALREAGRVARKGILLGVLNRVSPVAFWRRARRAKAYLGAHFFSPWELERLVRRSQGDRERVVRMKTGLYPLRLMDSLSICPFGAFIGMSVRFI